MSRATWVRATQIAHLGRAPGLRDPGRANPGRAQGSGDLGARPGFVRPRCAIWVAHPGRGLLLRFFFFFFSPSSSVFLAGAV